MFTCGIKAFNKSFGVFACIFVVVYSSLLFSIDYISKFSVSKPAKSTGLLIGIILEKIFFKLIFIVLYCLPIFFRLYYQHYIIAQLFDRCHIVGGKYNACTLLLNLKSIFKRFTLIGSKPLKGSSKI